MIRLLTSLAVFLFLTLWFLGADRGQYIHPPRPQEDAAATATSRPVFVPAKRAAGLPVGADPVTPVVAAEPEPTPDATGVAMALPEPVAPQPQVIRLMRAPAGATVYSGPGATYPATGTLRAGFVVMVVDDSSAPGWVRVRTDGGAAAWVAKGLLRE